MSKFCPLILLLLLNGMQLWSALELDPASIRIRIPVNPNASVQIAAQELQKHLEKITGIKPEITSTRLDEASVYVFHVGLKALDDQQPLQPEEARYQVTDNAAWLYGYDKFAIRKDQRSALEIATDWNNSTVGTMFAVYNFLEDQFAVRWLFPGDDGIAVQKQSKLILEKTSSRWIPQLQVRLLWSTSYEDWFYRGIRNNEHIPPEFKLTTAEQQEKNLEEKLWQRRMRMGQRTLYSHRHSFTSWWKRFGKTHPEYFALNPNGKREPWSAAHAPSRINMCASSTDLHKAVVGEWLKRRHQLREKTINICENDSSRYCRCKACCELDVPRKDETFGTHMTDRYVYFANSILREAKKVDKDAKVCTYAYQEYRLPPRERKVDEDVVISFVPELWDSEELQDIYRQWRKMGANTMLLRTNELHVDIGLPMGFEERVFRNFQIGVKNKIVGTRYDALHGYWLTSGLANYVLARGFSFPEKSFEDLENEYCSAYGAAAGYVRDYYRYWRKNVWEKRIWPARAQLVSFGHGFLDQALYWTRGTYYRETDFDHTDAILNAAAKEKLDAMEQSRLKQLLLANQHARKLYRAMKTGGQYADDLRGSKACGQNFNAIKELNEFRLQNRDKLPFNWGRMMQREIRYADGASTLLGKITEGMTPVLQLPSHWPFRIDDEKNIQNPDFKSWDKISINNFWQDTAKDAKTVWYGIELPDQRVFDKEKVYLVFGSLRGTVELHVNGNLISTVRPDWRKPFLVEIGQYLKPSNNKLAVKIQDSGEAAGIWRPVWIFAKQ